jgi:hypothetical protein
MVWLGLGGGGGARDAVGPERLPECDPVTCDPVVCEPVPVMSFRSGRRGAVCALGGGVGGTSSIPAGSASADVVW